MKISDLITSEYPFKVILDKIVDLKDKLTEETDTIAKVILLNEFTEIYAYYIFTLAVLDTNIGSAINKRTNFDLIKLLENPNPDKLYKEVLRMYNLITDIKDKVNFNSNIICLSLQYLKSTFNSFALLSNEDDWYERVYKRIVSCFEDIYNIPNVDLLVNRFTK